MKVPISWINEFVQFSDQLEVEAIVSAFIQLGFEVEEIDYVGQGISGPIVIGRVTAIEELSEFKKPIRYCQVDVGASNGGIRGIVCGATNFKVGDLVITALPGAELPGGFKIAQRETYGHISDGMICSLREIGIGEDHSGIFVLDDNFEIGTDAISTLGLLDVVLDLAVLPDRGYALSIRGLARELAIATKGTFVDPASLHEAFSNSKTGGVAAAISAKEDCQSLVLTTFKNVNSTAVTPWYIQRRLLLAGMRSISIAVDITNYIMLETGQPLHAFDESKISGSIEIRYSNANEEIETLDHVLRVLGNNELVVADKSKGLSLAGIMGGASSEVTASTSNLVIEAAHFSAEKTSETARRHILSSEASRRFERGVDPQLPAIASNYAVKLLIEHAGAEVVGRNAVIGKEKMQTIAFNLDQLQVISGINFEKENLQRILNDLGCQIIDYDNFVVQIPSWRPDLLTTNDLAEEILRISGYDQIPSVLIGGQIGKGYSLPQRLERQLKPLLAAKGFVEILNYPFVSQDDIDLAFSEGFYTVVDLVKIANPLSEKEPFLRPSLLPGLFAAAKRNLGRNNLDLAVFESGTVFTNQKVQSASKSKISTPPSASELAQLDAMIPQQQKSLAILMIGKKITNPALTNLEAWQWSDAISTGVEIMKLLNLSFEVVAGAAMPWHPGRCAEFWIGDQLVGIAGELHPRVIEGFELPARAIAIEMNFDYLLENGVAVVPAKPLLMMPVAKEDLAIVVANSVPAGAVLKSIRAAGGTLLEQAQVFDVYKGEQVPVGHKSLAISLRFRAPDRTLTTEEVSAVKTDILKRLEQEFAAKLRI